MQLKQRDGATDDPEVETRWFKKKIKGTATKQIRDSLAYLDSNKAIEVTNLHQHKFEIEPSKIKHVTKIIVFLASENLPDRDQCTRFHLSKTTGEFMHVIAAHDYLGILQTLGVPEEIARYFDYREMVVRDLAGNFEIEEPDIMGAFLTELDEPVCGSRSVLAHLLQDSEDFDLSGLLGDLNRHIEAAPDPYQYYEILCEFARTPRSMWRAIKKRLILALEASSNGEFTRPFRVTYPENDCSFMIAALDPDLPATGVEGEELRRNGLSNFCGALKHMMQSTRCIGILVSRDGEYVQIDWCLLDYPCRPEPELGDWLSKANPFRPASEKKVDGYFFKDLPPPYSRH